MSLFRQKIDAEELGAGLTYDIGKYGKGAEKALTNLLDSATSSGSVDSHLRNAGVAITDRIRFQLVFTAAVGELFFQSIQEREINRIRHGFLEGFTAMASELARMLGIDSAIDIQPKYHAADIAFLISSNEYFRSNKRKSYFPEGDPLSEHSVFVSLSDYVAKNAFMDSEVLRRNFAIASKRSEFIRQLSLSMGLALGEVGEIMKDLKPV